MPIPDYQTIMLPLLKFLSDKKEHPIRVCVEHISELFNLTEEGKKELLPSGRQSIIYNRVGWARTYMKKAGLLESPRSGYAVITSRGLEVLKENLSEINVKYLEKFPEFIEFKSLKREDKETEEEYEQFSKRTPQELLEIGHRKIENDLAEELLSQVKTASPEFFEKLVLDLLIKMGYGGPFKDAGLAIGRSGDEGIDGIIREDKLGLDAIYIQAKRWRGIVGRPEIQKFVGALQGHRARKGIFITTSDFSEDAKEYVSKIDPKIVLINGETLARYMIDNDVGVSEVSTYKIKKIDSDYFMEE